MNARESIPSWFLFSSVLPCHRPDRVCPAHSECTCIDPSQRARKSVVPHRGARCWRRIFPVADRESMARGVERGQFDPKNGWHEKRNFTIHADLARHSSARRPSRDLVRREETASHETSSLTTLELHHLDRYRQDAEGSMRRI